MEKNLKNLHIYITDKVYMYMYVCIYTYTQLKMYIYESYIHTYIHFDSFPGIPGWCYLKTIVPLSVPGAELSKT